MELVDLGLGSYLHNRQQSFLRVPHHLQRLLTTSGQRRHVGTVIHISVIASGVRAHLLKTPSTPVMPMPSTMSLDSLKGTVSGVGRVFPCSKATPERRNMKACWDALMPDAMEDLPDRT